MRRIYARLPDGTMIRRATYKKYTHVVICFFNGSWGPVRWTTTPDKALRDAQSKGYEQARLIEVLP